MVRRPKAVSNHVGAVPSAGSESGVVSNNEDHSRGFVFRFASKRNSPQAPWMSASFFALDHPLIWRSAEIASSIRSKC